MCHSTFGTFMSFFCWPLFIKENWRNMIENKIILTLTALCHIMPDFLSMPSIPPTPIHWRCIRSPTGFGKTWVDCICFLNLDFEPFVFTHKYCTSPWAYMHCQDVRIHQFFIWPMLTVLFSCVPSVTGVGSIHCCQVVDMSKSEPQAGTPSSQSAYQLDCAG